MAVEIANSVGGLRGQERVPAIAALRADRAGHAWPVPAAGALGP